MSFKHTFIFGFWKVVFQLQLGNNKIWKKIPLSVTCSILLSHFFLSFSSSWKKKDELRILLWTCFRHVIQFDLLFKSVASLRRPISMQSSWLARWTSTLHHSLIIWKFLRLKKPSVQACNEKWRKKLHCNLCFLKVM